MYNLIETMNMYIVCMFWFLNHRGRKPDTKEKERERKIERERDFKIYEETWMGIEVHEAWYKNRSKGVHTIIKKLKNVLSCYN